MKLKDYLHYYLGCKIQKDSDALDYPTVKGFHGDRVMISEYRYKTPNCDRVFTRPEMYHFIGFVKPILRRLEDMTDQEGIELTSRVVHSDEFINVNTYRNNFGDIITTWGLLSPMERANDAEYRYNATAERSWSAAQFHYLLQQGFDLFGLINAGLAIDAKTTTP